jgi:NTP pyrophosphatase (non-canonical NTP hydrolase)
MTKYQILSRRIGAFAKSRDWGQFRTPKNTAMTLGAEAGALVEHFLWLTQEESVDLAPAKRLAVKDEMADVFICLVRLADQLGVDLYAATDSKMADSELRHPLRSARGKGGQAKKSEA